MAVRKAPRARVTQYFCKRSEPPPYRVGSDVESNVRSNNTMSRRSREIIMDLRDMAMTLSQSEKVYELARLIEEQEKAKEEDSNLFYSERKLV